MPTLPPSAYPLRLSHSALDLLNVCERKFQLDRLMARDDAEEESAHLVFGTAYGKAIACYLEHQDRDLALLTAWLSYHPVVNYDKKTEESCVLAVQQSFDALDNLLEDYELVAFENKPAVELSFRMNINPQFYYVGYVDAVLRHRYSKKHYIFECKHTGVLLEDISPLYKHSGQALSYSIALDRIVGEQQSSYGVIYFVGQLQREWGLVKPVILTFDKTLEDRLNWFMTLGLDVQRLTAMLSFGTWPRRYQSCLKYNKPCFHFGTCHMHSLDRYKKFEPDTIDYQFTYELDELIADHLARIGA